MTTKKPKQKREAKQTGSADKEGSHKPNPSTVALLVVGTETGLHENTPARRRAVRYGEMLARYDAIAYGKGNSSRMSPIGENGSGRDVHRSSMFLSLYDAYKKGCEIVSASPERAWVVSAQDPFESGLIAWAIARKTSAALHLQLHTDPDASLWKQSRKNILRNFIYSFLAPRADAMRVVSERAKRSAVARGVPSERIAVVPIVSDDSSAQASGIDIRAAYKDAGEIILAMGRLSREKGFDVLIDAMRDIALARPSALLLLVGSGPELDGLKRRVVQFGLSAAVRFVPWVRDVGAYLRAADAVVMPSRYEGWGLVACEATTQGKAVVMTDVGCAGEVIVNEETGLVVPPEDAPALSEAIVRVLADGELRARLGAQAKVRAVSLVTNAQAMELHKQSWETAYRHGAEKHTERKKGG